MVSRNIKKQDIQFNSHIWFLILITLGISTFAAKGQDGKTLFQQNCTACHQLGSTLLGPDLLGINDKRSEEWLIKFIQSSQSLIKSGDPDAVAIYEEYNKTLMPNQPFSDLEVKAILAYIKEETINQAPDNLTADVEKQPEEPPAPFEYTQKDVEEGLALFSGRKPLLNKGSSCLSCHNVTNDKIMSGGLLAKDLTNAFNRMSDAGLMAIMNSPPFPAMAEAYNDNKLTEAEIHHITAFLANADEVSEDQELKSGDEIFLIGGGSGLILLLFLFSVIWKNRKKKLVKKDIFDRQLKSIN